MQPLGRYLPLVQWVLRSLLKNESTINEHGANLKKRRFSIQS